MSMIVAIARREVASFFRLPLGWIALALWALISGVVFALGVLLPGQAATLRPLFAVSGWLLLPIVPSVSMRLLSEELRSRTIDPLMASPVGDGAIVIGKFLGGGAFLMLACVPTVVLGVVLTLCSDPAPDPGPMVAGLLSLVLAGGLFLSMGLFASSLTSSQTLAFLSTFFAILLLLLVSAVPAEGVPEGVRPVLYGLGIGPRMADFAKGVIDTSHVVFFVSGTVWFLVLTYVSVQSRRWR